MKSLKTVMVGMMFLMSANIGNAQNVTEVVDSVKSGLKSKSVKEAVSKVQDAFKAKVAEADCWSAHGSMWSPPYCLPLEICCGKPSEMSRRDSWKS